MRRRQVTYWLSFAFCAISLIACGVVFIWATIVLELAWIDWITHH